MSSVKQKKSAKPLRESVRSALELYFMDLNGHQPEDLYRMVMGEVEHPLLETVMIYAQGNQTRAAEILGINRSTLRKKLKEHNLDR
ncbi:Fis family transcriptional regulator [Solemya pervernicosa gill symbiont]|uniref:Putative Fis-like DNA-binding protein n=2 Tax=Gammaproteobacteria incertae sedis TaxID=118884 RepID=A0A1T2L8Z4_9GAMM|nr:DNA-binding transcriptional regulator Fis [Candidatus Reidiella endopervernicosa]OOZ41577.1 Fis family transcriptional regulator [Solemya pervernicosa gill symbiont]QKQ27982.1 DNA-binding transcriptional regulator Fis [Candidatus Reidiella endopervernicosa]